MARSMVMGLEAVVFFLSVLATSTGKWTGDISVGTDSLTLTWDDTGVDTFFVKYVVQLYRQRWSLTCSDLIEPKVIEVPVYELTEATFQGLQPGTFYCRNCTIVATNGSRSCGELQLLSTAPESGKADGTFNSTSVTSTTITVTWPTFKEQSRREFFKVKYFLYYKIAISPRETGTNSPQVFYNETELEAVFGGLTPGKEYEIRLHTAGMYRDVVIKDYTIAMWQYETAAIIATDPYPVKKVSVTSTNSTSVTVSLVPPSAGFVDHFQVQAISPHHSSPLIDVPLSEKTPTGVRTTLSNLRPKTTYSISAATMANGKRGQTQYTTFTTEAVPVNMTVVSSVTVALMVSLIVAAFGTLKIVKRLKYKLDPSQLFKDVLEDIVGSEKMEPWLKSRKDLHLEELIGEGEFGHVRKGVLKEDGKQSVIVAAKTLRVDRANEMTYRDFAKEASLLIEVNDDGGHVNIVSLIGLVVEGGRKKDPRYILIEYVEPGELLWYLLSIQNNRYQADLPPGLGRQLTEVAIDIARGMGELKRRRITHRDLACRNIVLSSPDGPAGRLVAKISDFGLARDVYVNTQYMRHPLTNMLLPIKWMAIESLIEGVYSCKSDMWGFGVVLWEIATLGGTPYPEVYGYETLVTRLRHGYRLQKPNGCPDELYELMDLCWLDDPDVRPTPDVMEDRLEQLLQQDKAMFPGV